MDINAWNEWHKCNAHDGYLGGDHNQNHRNAGHSTYRSGSLIEKHARNQKSEVSLSFQTYSVSTCIRGARPELQQDYHSTLLLERGRCGVNSYEIGESSRGTGFPDPSYGSDPICKYYAQGRCQNAQNCRFPHFSAHQSQMGHDPVAMHTNHNFFRYGRENPGSEGKCNRFPLENFGSQEQTLSQKAASPNSLVLSSIQKRADSNNSDKGQSIPATTGNLNVQIGLRAAILTTEQHSGHKAQIQGAMHQIHGASKSGDAYKNFQLKYPEMSHYKGSPLVDFCSQVQNKHESCSQGLPFVSSIGATVGNINSEQFQSTHASNGNLSRKTAPWNIGQVAESQETIYRIREAPSVQFTTNLPTVTAPWNDQVHKNEFSVHQKTQSEFIVPQSHVNSPVFRRQGQPVLLRSHALADLSSHNGQRLNFDGQILENPVAASQSKEISKQVQGNGVQSIQMQSTRNLQPVGLNVAGQHQSSQNLSVPQHKRSAHIVGARIDYNTATSEGACIKTNLAPYCTKAPLTANPVQKQSSKRNRDPRLATSLSAAPSVPVPPNQQGIMVQPETSVLSGRKIHTFEIAIDSNGNPEILSHSVTLSAGNTIVNPSEGNKGESKCTVQAKENDNKHMNEHKMFKSALINFAKEGLKEAWHGGRLTKELYKVIVRKVVEKIMSSEKKIPKSKQKVESYLKLHKRKMDRLIQEYLGKYTNGKLCR